MSSRTSKNHFTFPKCGACRHPEHLLYEAKIISHEITMRAAARSMGIDISTVSRHMSNCVPKRVGELVKPEPTEVHDLNCVNILVSSHQDLRNIYTEAREKGDLRNSLKTLEVEIKQVHEIATLTGQTHDGPQFNLLMLPEYVEFKQTVLAAVSDYPEVRARISAALMCTEPEPGPEEDASDEPVF